jgi:NAD(P)-dependent dehydrogenase (short-subunit alcohol dehydrogenase family)
MRAGGGGSIVNISSIAGIGQLTTREPAYAANKGAIWVFSKVTATQHGKDNIRCNSVHPGHVDTEMFRATFLTPEALAEHLSRVPMRRAGLVEEIVSGMIYLASDESSYVTGAELGIGGGALSI